jgi:chromosome partitioning protein
VLDAVIPRNVRVSEAPGYGQSVVTYDPGSRGSTSYVEAARELAQRGVALPPLPSRPTPGSPVAVPLGAAFPDTDAATVPVPPSSEERP